MNEKNYHWETIQELYATNMNQEDNITKRDDKEFYQKQQSDLQCRNNDKDYETTIIESILLVLSKNLIVDFSKLKFRFQKVDCNDPIINR